MDMLDQHLSNFVTRFENYWLGTQIHKINYQFTTITGVNDPAHDFQAMLR